MAILSGEAIVLGARPYSNTSLIVTLLTKDQGKVRLVAKGVRSAKSRVGVGLEPASESHIEWSRRSSSDLGTMRKCETTRVYQKLWKDYEAMRTASRLLKTLDVVLGVGEGEAAHYLLLKYSLESLEKGVGTASMEGIFLLMLLKAMGLGPGLDYCAACEKKPGNEAARFDIATGELRCARCPEPIAREMRLRAGAIAAMREVLRLTPDKCYSIRFAAPLGSEIIGCAEAFLQFHGGKTLPKRAGRTPVSR
ncbi:MAG: DNA repair protein RecO [Nitrospinae bacterium]|nr:DNA repair protein RecO [Nitrospinota bacterium]